MDMVDGEDTTTTGGDEDTTTKEDRDTTGEEGMEEEGREWDRGASVVDTTMVEDSEVAIAGVEEDMEDRMEAATEAREVTEDKEGLEVVLREEKMVEVEWVVRGVVVVVDMLQLLGVEEVEEEVALMKVADREQLREVSSAANNELRSAKNRL